MRKVDVARSGLVLAIVLAARGAHADEETDKQAHAAADAGATLFDKDDFAGAANKFQEAYALNHDPSYLFNIAQAYRHTGDCIRSADYYGRFLADVPHPPNEDKIRVWYASELHCAKERAASQPHDAEPAKPHPDEQPVTQTPPPSGGRRGIALVLASTGAVALGVGGFFIWDANFLSTRRAAYLDHCTIDNRCSAAVVDDYDHRGARADTLMIVGLVAGGVALAASATVYLVSRSETALPVAVAPTRGGAVVTAAFAW